MRARDGSPDTILCGAGTDTVEADTLDIVSTTCENVSTQATPGGPFDDRPPLMTWTAPAAGADAARERADDAGGRTRPTTAALVRVQFFDDDRLLCEDTAVPFTCAFQPRGGDVGRNTLLAVGIDGANQTTTLVRPVTVRRFTSPGLGLSLRPSRDRRVALRVPRHRAAAAAEHGGAVAGLLRRRHDHGQGRKPHRHHAPGEAVAHLRVQPDADAPHAAREPAAPDRALRRQRGAGRRRRRATRTVRLG